MKNTITINNNTKTIPEGSYAIDDLLDYLNLTYINKYVFTYDDVIRKVTITASGAYITIDSSNNILKINNRTATLTNGEYTASSLVSYLNTLTEFRNGATPIYSFSVDGSNNLNVSANSDLLRYYFPIGTSIYLMRYDGIDYDILFNGWQLYTAIVTEIEGTFDISSFLNDITLTLADGRYRFTIPNYASKTLLQNIYVENFDFLGFTGDSSEVSIVGSTKYITATNLCVFFDVIALGKVKQSTSQTVDNPIASMKRFETVEGTVLKLIGFETTETASNSTSIVSPYVYNLNTSQHMYVKSNFQVANIASFDKRSGYTLAYVPLGAFDSVISYQNYSSAYLKTDTKNINYIDIKITDDEDEYIDFKNHNWSLSLEFLVEKLF